jgi:hypothetical protein
MREGVWQPFVTGFCSSPRSEEFPRRSYCHHWLREPVHAPHHSFTPSRHALRSQLPAGIPRSAGRSGWPLGSAGRDRSGGANWSRKARRDRPVRKVSRVLRVIPAVLRVHQDPRATKARRVRPVRRATCRTRRSRARSPAQAATATRWRRSARRRMRPISRRRCRT